MEVSPTDIKVFDKIKKENVSIPCGKPKNKYYYRFNYFSLGMTVWATGVGPTPLTTKLAESIPEQQHNKALVTDEFLRVKGVPNNNISQKELRNQGL